MTGRLIGQLPSLAAVGALVAVAAFTSPPGEPSREPPTAGGDGAHEGRGSAGRAIAPTSERPNNAELIGDVDAICAYTNHNIWRLPRSQRRRAIASFYKVLVTLGERRVRDISSARHAEADLADFKRFTTALADEVHLLRRFRRAAVRRESNALTRLAVVGDDVNARVTREAKRLDLHHCHPLTDLPSDPYG